jgi:hypothetical protein
MSEEEAQTPKAEDKPPPERAEPEAGPHEAEEIGSADEETILQNASTIVNIMGMKTEGAWFGPGGAGRGPSTGTIKAAVIRNMLRAFCTCDAFRQAQRVLAEHGMVVLVGGQGSGRYTAAIALLAGWPALGHDASVVSLSPTSAVRDLAERAGGKERRCYLVHDLRSDGRPSADQRFELTRLRHRLSQASSRLVVTAEATMVSRRDFDELIVPWSPPDGSAILEEHLGAGGPCLEAADVARAKKYASELTRPCDVVAFVGRISRDGIDAAMLSQRTVDREYVANWFDDHNPHPTT